MSDPDWWGPQGPQEVQDLFGRRSVREKREPIRFIDPSGRALTDLPISDSEVLELHKLMLFCRTFDRWIQRVHPLGAFSRYAPFEGQEASMVGSASALSDLDWIIPTYREYAVFLVRGVPVRELLLRLVVRKGDPVKGHELTLYGSRRYRIVMPTGAVGIMTSVAVGIAWGIKMRRAREIVLTYLGDGATSKGDFHEGLNMAGVMRVPAIFFCQNNRYAISLPVERQTASPTIAEKGMAYGIDWYRVDGNDVVAVKHVTSTLVERARSEYVPFLVEALTYRLGPHTTVDNPKVYRSDEEVRAWRAQDPLLRTRAYLKERGMWGDDEERAYVERVESELNAEIERVLKEHELEPEVILEDVYSYPTREVLRSMEELRKQLERIKVNEGHRGTK
jgi:pyruvate dehydrogenase E1 component alpha subunit